MRAVVSVYVIVVFPMSETGAQDFIAGAKGESGYANSEM